MNKEYKLDVPKTSKDLIDQPEICEQGVLPKLHFSMLAIGSSGRKCFDLQFNFQFLCWLF